ncbi:hypothetical protein M3J09_009162 [Ascochyta lentis]
MQASPQPPHRAFPHPAGSQLGRKLGQLESSLASTLVLFRRSFCYAIPLLVVTGDQGCKWWSAPFGGTSRCAVALLLLSLWIHLSTSWSA